MSLLEWMTMLMLPVLAAGDLLIDAVSRRRPRALPGWRLRAAAVTVVIVALSIYSPMLWARAIGERTLLDLRGLGPWLGALVGIVVYELFHYGYHRAAHTVPLLWRWHQMHHAPERLDALGASYLHPIDALCFSSIGTLVAAPLLGLAPEAAGLVGLFLAFNGVFQHLDVPTPRWLGWVIQRPESHLVHHARDFQWTNYSDLPLWDWLFGTLTNPTARPSGPLGFWDGASARLGDQLLLRDVTVEPRPAQARPAYQGPVIPPLFVGPQPAIRRDGKLPTTKSLRGPLPV